jgi:hypothetical protein
MVKEWNYENEWFEETNISRKIRDYLEMEGYEIIKFNEDKRQRGHDIVATKSGEKLIVEVKGYPSNKYVGGEKKGQKKPTNPNLQAKHWFGEALLSLLIAKSENPKCKTVIGLPKFKTYENLISKLNTVREKLGIAVILVDKEGNVNARNLWSSWLLGQEGSFSSSVRPAPPPVQRL